MPQEPQKEITEKYILIQPQNDVSDDEIDLFELLAIPRKWWYLIVMVVILSVLTAIIHAKSLPDRYKADAVIMNISSEGAPTTVSSGGLAQMMQGFGVSLNMAAGGGKGDSIVNILESRSFMERVVDHFDMLPELFKDRWDQAEKRWKVPEEKQPTLLDGALTLQGSFKVDAATKPGLMILTWDGSDPQFCSLMLNRIINTLELYLETESLTESKRTRIFVEEQLDKATRDMKYWRQRVPDEKMTMDEILMERGIALSIYQQMRSQLESSKVEEAKEKLQFKVLDLPYAPKSPYKPDRRSIVMITLMASILGALILSFLVEFSLRLLQEKKKRDSLSKIHNGK